LLLSSPDLCWGGPDPPSSRDYLLVSVGPRDGLWEKEWLDVHAGAGFRFRPLLVEPDPTYASELSDLAATFGGRFVQGAAWTHGGERRVLQNAGSSSATMLDFKDMNRARGDNSTALVVETVAFEPLIWSELLKLRPKPFVVMHMDCEGL